MENGVSFCYYESTCSARFIGRIDMVSLGCSGRLTRRLAGGVEVLVG
jgi:hypothetical protein